MADFRYQDPFPLGPDATEYRKLTSDHVSTAVFEGRTILKVDLAALTILASEAVHDVSHLNRTSHLKGLAKILDDPEASDNDRYVARELLENAVIAADGVLPGCQDTGTAIVFAKKGERVWTGGGDEEALSLGVLKTYTETNLRYSQLAPLGLFEEKNTGSNLPAQIDIQAAGGHEYRFLFITKGGGSANKSFLYQETKALLNPDAFYRWVDEKIRTLGTAACPPYHLAIVVGGTSAEATMKTVKLATAGYLDALPARGSPGGHAFRDIEAEAKVLEISQKTGIGAQFGGKYFCHDVRVVRLPRHGASCPVGIGVSCSADRNILGRITREGVFLEKLDADPGRFLAGARAEATGGNATRIDLRRPFREVLATLSRLPVTSRVLLTGDLIVARDIAHARLKERLDLGEGLPQYFKDHVIYYAGPAKTPQGYASGSFGPTTAGRMDAYIPAFQAAGASLVTLAKGNRSAVVTESCKRHGGFYLGSIGGAAAKFGKDYIAKVEVVDYPELGMEAIYKISVVDLPAFVVVDDKGNDFFERFRPAAARTATVLPPAVLR
ncbi:MAG: fumarate hydratase [Planctomycetes bacterium]|nr:fumarate hydratase [Planctomycetota bacterium]